MTKRSAIPKSFVMLVACHNRKDKSLAFLQSVFDLWPSSVHLQIIVLDDGSSDGTARAIQDSFPEVQLEYGDGTLFWNGAMAKLLESAFDLPFEHVILANDDIVLLPESLGRFIDTYVSLNELKSTALVGAFSDAMSGATTYSGFRRLSRRSPLAVASIEPDGSLQSCDSFNANFVALPLSRVRDVGGLDRSFTHGFGDIDLGYRLRRHGTRILLYLSHIGTCSRNPKVDAAALRGLPFRDRWDLVFKKYRIAGDYRRFVQKHSPVYAPILIIKDTLMRVSRVMCLG